MNSHYFTAEWREGRGMGRSWAPAPAPATGKHSSTPSAHLSKIFQGKSSGMAFPRN